MFDQPPTLQPFDVQLRQMKLTTFALGLPPGAIAGQKGVPRPPYEEMRDRIRSVVQDLTLNYYVRSNVAGDADRAWLQLADELDFEAQLRNCRRVTDSGMVAKHAVTDDKGYETLSDTERTSTPGMVAVLSQSRETYGDQIPSKEEVHAEREPAFDD
ncbi:hypothetical protein OHC33_011268 [Knufia fluminis]|uniref:Uncharacterized protein n=1 Tax=Knufia fluminis TaxID=191047 RepID=A0AAN8E7E0_9EURO|nr:hypothetical protein OHC33_011268 [Knufia fluminis]